MSARPEKHSLTLRGHRTSVSLERAFWEAFRDLAAARGQTLNQLAAEIDAGRDGDIGLASAIRVHLLAHFRALASGSEDGIALRGTHSLPQAESPP
jgi:predicted DNA-binding ribbon-helix-helix protein